MPTSAYAQATGRARRLGRRVLLSATRPAPTNDALAFFAQAAGGSRALWLRPATGEALVAAGAALTLERRAAAPDRFAAVAAEWKSLLADAIVSGPGGPRLVGGFSFDARHPPSPAWRAFPAARFVLPERMLRVGADGAWLTTSTLIEHARSPESSASREAANESPARLDSAAWKELVRHVARGIRRGDLGVQKLVLARAEDVAVERFDAAVVARRLADAYPTCTIFAVEHAGACFLGATPEGLVTLRDGVASTMALAGSVPRGATPQEDQRLAEQLLASPKERAEHAYVVRALRDGLAEDGLCTSVLADAGPRVRKLSNVQHLYTPIRGQLAPGRDVLDLVARLHPSPAVGGYPGPRALQLLREHEQLDRGWYAGALGWLDDRGEGEFVVGIRSALVRNGCASIFAGCGIVADSDADAEYQESVWKLRPMLAALRVRA